MTDSIDVAALETFLSPDNDGIGLRMTSSPSHSDRTLLTFLKLENKETGKNYLTTIKIPENFQIFQTDMSLLEM